MRIKNKEIRQRRHRKEQTIKAAHRENRATWANKPAAAAGSSPEKAAPKAKAAAPRKTEATTKPKKAPAKKKEEAGEAGV